jgi:3-phenylpropionate/trans-cinnamate dioxygenase ferredoxin subunit
MAEQALTFVTVCKTEDLPPGSRMVVELGRKWIVIFNVNGEYHAIEDLCSHDEVALSEGTLIDDYTIECSAHGACFDIRTGAVKAPPANVPVRRYATRVVDDEIQVTTRPA